MTEWTKAAVFELDFTHESVSLMEVAKGLSSGDSDTTTLPAHISTHVVVPRVIAGYTSKELMVLEFSPGVSVGCSEVQVRTKISNHNTFDHTVTPVHTIGKY